MAVTNKCSEECPWASPFAHLGERCPGCVPRSGVAGVWGMCSPQRSPRPQFTPREDRGSWVPSTGLADGDKVKHVATSLPFLSWPCLLALPPRKRMRPPMCHVLRYLFRQVAPIAGCPHTPSLAIIKALTWSQPAGQGMVGEPKDIPKCMAGPKMALETSSILRVQPAWLLPLSGT